MKSVVIAVLVACVIAAFPARAQLYACIGAGGKKSFTSDPNDPGCKLQPSYEPGAKKPAALPPPKPAVKAAPPPKKPKKITIPNVAPREQSGRDLMRRQILVHELNREIKTRATYSAQIKQAASEKVRAYFGRLMRVHELNIVAIRRELDLLGGSSARN